MSAELLGLNIDDYSFDEAIEKAKLLIDGQKAAQVVTINPEMFNQAEKDAGFANIVKEAEMVIPDGIGVKIALKILGHNVQRIPGIDFAKQLLLEASSTGIPVAIIGAKREIIEKAVENLQKEGKIGSVLHPVDEAFSALPKFVAPASLDKLLDKPAQKFIENFKKANKGQANLEKQVEGIKIIKPMLILGIIYYTFIPFVSTYMAELADKNPKFDLEKRG